MWGYHVSPNVFLVDDPYIEDAAKLTIRKNSFPRGGSQQEGIYDLNRWKLRGDLSTTKDMVVIKRKIICLGFFNNEWSL